MHWKDQGALEQGYIVIFWNTCILFILQVFACSRVRALSNCSRTENVTTLPNAVTFTTSPWIPIFYQCCKTAEFTNIDIIPYWMILKDDNSVIDEWHTDSWAIDTHNDGHTCSSLNISTNASMTVRCAVQWNGITFCIQEWTVKIIGTYFIVMSIKYCWIDSIIIGSANWMKEREWGRAWSVCLWTYLTWISKPVMLHG